MRIAEKNLGTLNTHAGKRQSDLKDMQSMTRGNAYQVKRYNPGTRPRHSTQVELKRYAEHHGNVMNTRIKSHVDNTIDMGNRDRSSSDPGDRRWRTLLLHARKTNRYLARTTSFFLFFIHGCEKTTD